MNKKALSLFCGLAPVSLTTFADDKSLQSQIDLLRQELHSVRQELNLLKKG
jgi:hypothetical protein